MEFRTFLRAALLAAWILGPLVLGGCATPGRAARQETARKKAQAHLAIAIDHLTHERVALALRALLSAEALEPEDPRIQFALAQAYLARGRASDCEAHLHRALELHPGFHDARQSLSALYLNTERYEDAAAESRILLDDPTFAAPWDALGNLGWASLKLGRSGEARLHLEEAISQNNLHWPSLLSLGILEVQEGHRLAAANLFSRVLQLAPGPHAEAEANYRIGEIYVSLGQRKRAVRHLLAAVAQTPDGQWGLKSEEYLNLLR